MLKSSPLIIGLLLLAGCTSTEADKPDEKVIIKKTTRLSIPKMNAETVIGMSIGFAIETGEIPLDSVIVSGPNFSETFLSSNFSWVPTTAKTGRFNFKVSVYCQGESETHYPRLTMLSDIEPEQLTYQIVNSYPHSTDAYTQGLFFLGDDLIESTGQKGESVIKKIALNTGKEIIQTPIANKFFGEGSTLYKDEIYMVTWTSQTGFVFDTDLNQKRTFQYGMQGWGLTTLGDSLLMTDGSEKLYFMSPEDFTEIDHLEVYNHKALVENLNELELIDGLVYANEWHTDNVHIVDPETGKVLKTVDFSGLLTESEKRKADVLNGIAYHEETARLFVTGKYWPWIFEVKLQPKNT